MADFEENVEEIMETTREAAGGDRVQRGRDGDETGGPGCPENETGDKTATTAGDERDGVDRWGNVCGRRSVYNRHSPSLFGEHCEILRWQTLRKTLKRWWGRLAKRRMATESGGDETAKRPAITGARPATRRRRRLVMNETVATGGVMYTNKGELEFDEDEMAALEEQRLVAEFRCGIY